MHERDRRHDHRRFGLAIVALVSVAFAAGALFWLGQYQTEYVNRQEEGANNRQEAPDTKCYTLLGIATLCVGGDNDAKYEADRSEQDLRAQQDMAEWARWLTMLTALQAIIGGVGLWFIFRSLEQGAEATRQATIATEAATRSANAAENAYVAENRPWMDVTITEVRSIEVLKESIVLDFTLSATNIGKVPTNVRFFASVVRSGPFTVAGLSALDIAIEYSNDFHPFEALTLPGKETGMNYAISDSGIDDPELRQRERRIRENNPGVVLPEHVNVTIVFGVQYQGVGAEKWHHTAYVAHLAKKDVGPFSVGDKLDKRDIVLNLTTAWNRLT